MMSNEPSRIFVSYKRSAQPDEAIAHRLEQDLAAAGHKVFIDRKLRSGTDWLEEIDRQLKKSDFLVVLLSEASADSEMIQAEVRRAYDYRKNQGWPRTLPVRINYKGMLPYSIHAFLDQLQYFFWQDEEDNERLSREIILVASRKEGDPTPLPRSSLQTSDTLSEDGRPVDDVTTIHPPLPEFDPRFIEKLEAPGGAIKLRDTLYVKREADARLKNEIVKAGVTITIRASRQMGKSSLVIRGLDHARRQGARIVHLDLQRVDRDYLEDSDIFLRYLAEFLVRKLRLDVGEVNRMWQGSLGPQDKLTYLFEDYILPELNVPIVFALDEVDRLLETPFHSDFFALIRSWHNNRALDEIWDLLNLVMVISTEPYLLIADTNQSPFNVGLKLYLEDFNEEQVRALNERHGAPVQARDLPNLMQLLSGHPFLTRKAFYYLVTETPRWDEFVDIAPSDRGPFSDHLRRYHWLVHDEADLRAALKQVVQHGACPDDQLRFRLERAGLIRAVGEVCQCRCELYRVYFEDKL